MSRQNRIRLLREQAGMTLAMLAHDIDRCEGSVSLYERGKRDVPLSVLHRIAWALKVAPSALLPDVLEQEEDVFDDHGHAPVDSLSRAAGRRRHDSDR